MSKRHNLYRTNKLRICKTSFLSYFILTFFIKDKALGAILRSCSILVRLQVLVKICAAPARTLIHTGTGTGIFVKPFETQFEHQIFFWFLALNLCKRTGM
jgi:phospholipid N-methyltransferase